ncbi:DUF2079 domain-containing protein [Actinotignum schaalii]|uniref:DUF2079 domain-containing protein n=1 Tax=Actinotignum schaalii FB123-CNA-2 TaxID=883067 RepID=S2VPN9_9ACTO|nr:DUF2079 domain-containing protein [Actinotignum schaalii]EPD28761.1 hypothetical protein HMPREF9237_00289 [Actinotignum schaalii FB123-CNA-2]
MRGGPARELEVRGARAPSRTAVVRAWACNHCDTTALLLAAGAFAVYMFFSWYTWVNFSSPSWDQGIFTQLADRYARRQFPPIVDIKGPGFNLWGDHFHPILLLTGPLFWLWPSGLSLLALQAVLFGMSVYPIARFARARVGAVPGTLIGVAYAASWGLTSALVVQFHEIAFAVPLLAFGLTAWLEGRYRRAAVLISLLVFVKEDLGLTVACFGVLAALLSWRGRGGEAGAGGAAEDGSARQRGSHGARDWRELAGIGAFLAAWGTAWFLAATQVILPAFNNSGQWDYAGRVREGLDLASMLLEPNRWGTLCYIVAALGIVGLRSPWAALLLPTLAWRFVGDNPYYWTILWHYSAVLAPMIAVALTDGLARAGARGVVVPLPEAQESQAPSAATAQRDALGVLARCPRLAAAALALALISSVLGTASNGFGSWLTGRSNTQQYVYFSDYGASQTAEQREGARAAVAAAGTGRHILADVVMMAYVVPGNTVYWEHSYGGAYIDTVVFSNRLNHGDGAQVVAWITAKVGGQWHIVTEEAGYVVVARDGTDGR